MKKYYPKPYFSNWVDNFFPPIAGLILPFISKFSFVSPNFLTIISFLLYILGSISIIFSLNKIFIVIVFFFSYLFDCLDGQLARYKKQSTLLGKFLDNTFDYLKFYFLFLAVSLLTYFKTNNIFYILIGLSSAFFFGFRFYIKHLLIYLNFEIDKNFLIKSEKRKEQIIKVIDREIEENKKTFFGKIKNFFKINKHILRIDEGEIILFLVMGYILDNLPFFIIFVFLVQFFWVVFRLIQRGYQLVFDLKKLYEPILR